MAKSSDCVIIFVEGETEVAFFEKLMTHLKQIHSVGISKYKIVNAKGIGRFESKVPGKFKNEIAPRYKKYIISVCCCYDIDVFKFKSKPPINWQKINRKLIENGANKVIFVEANKMIEDWFLHDLSGLCRFLKIVKPKNIKGKDGNEKMISLFKKTGKIYQKGTYCYHFLDSLDISIIYEQEKAQLKALEDLLFRKK
jgi:hypothetical protein